MWSMLRSTWAFWYFIISSIKNEFTSRFIRSRIGGIWMIINPLVQVCIYALILSSLLSARLPELADQTYGYAIYLTAGILCWSLFSDVVTRCLTIFIENGNILKKMVFPKICLPLITTGTALVNNALLLLAIIAVFAVLGHGLAPSILLLPVLTGLTLALALGFGIVLGILNVFIRDIGQVIPLVLQIGFWFTPVVYGRLCSHRPAGRLAGAADVQPDLSPGFSLSRGSGVRPDARSRLPDRNRHSGRRPDSGRHVHVPAGQR
jgi:lipopolysaccharide transport system permease protein